MCYPFKGGMYKIFKPLSEQDKEVLREIGKKDFTNYKEQDIREEVIAPIVKLLGYEKNSDYEVEREESYKANELFIKIGSRERQKLDYLCNIRKNNFWLIEAKNGESKEISQEQLEQAYFYSIHPKVNCRYFAVTNGWLFNLYDRNKFLSDDNSDIFTPIFSIKHSELEQNFYKLYEYLGASNIIFNVKSECLLKEIEKTLSAEVYLKRLDYFKRAVDSIITKSERSVYRNIGKLESISDEKRKEYLISLNLGDLISASFGYRTIHKRLSESCEILKERVIDFSKDIDENHNPVDKIIYELLPTENYYQITLQDPVFLYNVLSILINFKYDDDFKEIYCNYNSKKMYLPDLLEEYLYEFYSFFPNKPHIRLLLCLYPMLYRYSKMIVYGYEPVKAIAIFKHRYNECYLTEEELGSAFYSKGHELIKMAENITFQILEIIYKRIYDNNRLIKTEEAEKIIKQIESDIKILEKTTNYENMIKSLPEDEQDGMLALDEVYENPWKLMFFAISNILPTNYKHSQRCLERIKQYNELGFNFENNQLNEEQLQKQEKILNTLKYNFSKLDNIL